MLEITQFTVEYRTHALGIDERAPRFSWVLVADGNNVMQEAYELTVRTGGHVVWHSERESDKSVLIEYEGETLLPRTEYEVTLRVRDRRGESACSKAVFETGVMEEGLKGEFIARPFGDVVPELSRTFHADRCVARARIYATALGVYELFLNGTRVGDAYDAPGWTSYPHRLQYQTYDVTDLVREGENELSALVGKGWYSGTLGYYHRKNCYGEKNALCLDMYIDYTDGSTERISTDTNWRARESALRFSEFQDGEVYDSTFSAAEDFPVEIVKYPKGKIIAQVSEPVRVTEELSVADRIVTPRGEQVLDFGQNALGIVQLSLIHI